MLMMKHGTSGGASLGGEVGKADKLGDHAWVVAAAGQQEHGGRQAFLPTFMYFEIFRNKSFFFFKDSLSPHKISSTFFVIGSILSVSLMLGTAILSRLPLSHCQEMQKWLVPTLSGILPSSPFRLATPQGVFSVGTQPRGHSL